MTWLIVRALISIVAGTCCAVFGVLLSGFAPNQQGAAKQAVGFGVVITVTVFVVQTFFGDAVTWMLRMIRR
jgi:hypothetical protein